jgi:magnesium transporter
MKKASRKRVKPAGSSPGTVVYVGAAKTAPISITYFRYSREALHERVISDLTTLEKPDASEGGVSWYNIDGVHDPSVLQTVGRTFDLHPLEVEDIANTTQRPKIEDFSKNVFVTLKMIEYRPQERVVRSEHVSLVLGEGFVLSFLEDHGDVFEPVRARIRHGKGQIRGFGADYLVYALIDAVVDRYFEVLEELGEDIDHLDRRVITDADTVVLTEIYNLKRELIHLRRAVWPLREAIHVLIRDESELVRASTHVYLRDVYDHSVQVMDGIETLRDIVSGMLDVYLSSTNNRLGQVMKVLTIMSSIFIPLTFIAGIYGMNFEHMPETRLVWGYPAVLAMMVCIAAGLLILFRRNKWI